MPSHLDNPASLTQGLAMSSAPLSDPAAPIVGQLAQAVAQLAIGQLTLGQLTGDRADPAGMLALAQAGLQQGRAAQAIPLLQRLHALYPAATDAARLLGYALRQEQRFAEADAVFTAALPQAPRDVALCFGQAQSRYELGLPAAGLFAKAQKLAPADLELLRNRALAMASEGDRAGAERVLHQALKRHPDWLDGHKVLTSLRWTGGDHSGFADHYAAAVRAQPGNQNLWLNWFSMLAQVRDWAGARKVLDQAERKLGQQPALLAARLFVAVESHDDAAAAPLLMQTAHVRGEITSLCRIRHALRHGDWQRAEAEALPLTATPSAAVVWPYLSLIWRLSGDARWEWLDRPGDLVQPCDSGIPASELAELAEVLRGLHTAAAPYIEQSVRGGTQTDRSVLLRHEPVLQRTRTRLLEVIRDYVDALPPHNPAHPLLCAPRSHLLVEGSWSVRLLKQGYNVPHSHAKGWLSTAFYVSLPGADQMGAAPAGHIAFGTPPAELGLDLAAYRTIRPEAGRLAVFPSTMWHGTVPFDDGERLVIAFDVRRPNY